MKNRTLDQTDLTWLARLARSLIGEAHAADDLVQETAIAAMTSQLPPEGGRRAWLAGVARRLAARHFRGESRRARREQAAAEPTGLPDAAELAERAEIAEQLSSAARRLPEPLRRTILLRFLEGLSPEEIARRDGKPADTVRWRVRRGLELMRQDLVRRHDRDWSSWCVLLTPLAHAGGRAGIAAVGTTGASAGWVAALIAMKATLMATAVLTVVGLFVWFANDRTSVASPDASGGTSREAASTPPPEPPSVLADAGAAGERTQVASDEDAPSVAPAASGTGLYGRVVDAEGKAVPGATVYLLSGNPSSGKVGDRVLSDASGAFRFAWLDRATQSDLGVAANGFLRRVLQRAWPERAGGEVVVVLERGRRLTGVVVDEYARPIPDLELLCHTARAGVSHVSPSQMALRSERRRLGGATSPYQQFRGRTDANGVIEMRGLSTENLVLRSLDPLWTIDNAGIAADEAGYVTWVASRQLGVRLTVVDKGTGQPVELARATFGCEVTFADGEDDTFEQWVGRGRGEATFVFDSDLVPGIEDRVITRAVFYGTAGTADIKVPWRAEPIVNARKATGVAEVRVEVDAFGNGGLSAEPPPTAVLEFDVRYAGGAPFDRKLEVRWSARSDQGHRRQDSDSAKRLPNGRYRLEVVAGTVDLDVSDSTASGSLPGWSQQMRCEPGRTTVAFVTLPRGAAVEIPQPSGWRGTWYVRASWRPSPDAEWRGSWNYTTRKNDLVLTALRPAEWRFELRRDDADRDPIVRTALLVEGVETRVDR